MRVLDLFAGLRGWSAAATERGHDVVTVDVDARFTVTHHLDIGDVDSVMAALGSWRPHLVLASPPCDAFTVMTMGRNWYRGGEPKTEAAAQGLRLVVAMRELVARLGPAYLVIENPRGMLRTMPHMADLDRRTVTYCQLGESRMKPTDLWGGFPPSLVLPAPCRNGDPCHVRAPRGSYTPGSTRGLRGSALRAEIPLALALLVTEAAERDLAGGRVTVAAPRPAMGAQATIWGTP